MSVDERCDVVIVGAGSAGCALAAHLALTSDLRIALVEAGPDYGPFAAGGWPDDLRDPRRFPLSHDWGFVEERASGEPRVEPRARVVGGCSAHNQCAAVWGSSTDYDVWAAAGNPGWSHAELEPLLHEVEATLRPQISGDGELAGWQRAFVQASLGAGFVRDQAPGRTERPSVVGAFPATIRDGVRWHAAFAFLDAARRRPNLSVRDRLVVDHLVIESGRATSVVCRSATGTVEFGADRFVLAAGVYGSPAILLRSGVGRAEELRRIGIAPRISLEGVGRNLHDHPGITVRFEPSAAGAQVLDGDLGSGRLAQSQVILKATSGENETPVDLHLLPYQAPTDTGRWRFEILCFAMSPLSRGRVALRSSDPAVPPRIEFDFLSDADGHDAQALRRGVELARHIAESSPLRELVVREVAPGRGVTSAKRLDEYVRDGVAGYGHAGGTCRMGPASDAEAVVDHTGLVHGTANVFVADASIMPRTPRANTNLTCYVIGRRMASMVVDSMV